MKALDALAHGFLLILWFWALAYAIPALGVMFGAVP